MRRCSSSFGFLRFWSRRRFTTSTSRKVNALFLILARAVWAHPVDAAPEVDPLHTKREASSPRSEVGVRAHIGVATTPFYVPELPNAKGHVVVLVPHARYSLDNGLRLGLAVPTALGSVAQPAGSFVDASALGNPTLELLHAWPLAYRPLTLGLGFALGAPLATSGNDLMPNRLLAIADGLEGRTRPEWFTPGVLPLVPSLQMRADTGAWQFDFELRTPVLVRVSDASTSHADKRALGLAAVVAGRARVDLSDTFSVSGSVQLFVDLVPVARPVASVSPWQDFEQLGLDVHLTANTTLSIELQTAAGGELGGTMIGGGLGLGLMF